MLISYYPIGYNRIISNTVSLFFLFSLLVIPDPVIGNFNAEPDNFIGLEISCLASLEYDKFYLSCMASKPEIVVPQLEVIWLHNGVKRTDNSEIVTNGTHIVNTLTFTTTTSSDTGNYTCISRVMIPDSTTIQLSEESIIVIRGN